MFNQFNLNSSSAQPDMDIQNVLQNMVNMTNTLNNPLFGPGSSNNMQFGNYLYQNIFKNTTNTSTNSVSNNPCFNPNFLLNNIDNKANDTSLVSEQQTSSQTLPDPNYFLNLAASQYSNDLLNNAIMDSNTDPNLNIANESINSQVNTPSPIAKILNNPLVKNRRTHRNCSTLYYNRKSLNGSTNSEYDNQDRPYRCEYEGCNKAYKKVTHLNAHYVVHNGATPFHCKFVFADGTVCQDEFARSDQLTRHVRKHKNEKNFKCRGCNKAFFRPDHCKTHEKICKKLIQLSNDVPN